MFLFQIIFFQKAVEKEKKKKAKKAKQLPQLQFNSKPLAAIEEKKRGDADVFHSPSIASSTRHHTFSTTTRSRLHTDRSASSILTHTIGRTVGWKDRNFNGVTAQKCAQMNETRIKNSQKNCLISAKISNFYRFSVSLWFELGFFELTSFIARFGSLYHVIPLIHKKSFKIGDFS